jgi:hypothetical protein
MKKDAPVLEDPSHIVLCPVCEARPHESCHVQPGVLRPESHLERNDFAAKVRGDAQPKPHKVESLQHGRKMEN